MKEVKLIEFSNQKHPYVWRRRKFWPERFWWVGQGKNPLKHFSVQRERGGEGERERERERPWVKCSVRDVCHHAGLVYILQACYGAAIWKTNLRVGGGVGHTDQRP